MLLVAARELARQFDAEPVFRNVSFEVRAGEKIGLVGPNGCGKTTLLHILAGLDEPDIGSVERHPTAAFGLLEQEPELAADHTLRAEVQAGLAPLYKLQSEAHELADRLADTSDAAELDRLQRRYDEIHLHLDRLDAYHIEHRVDEVLHGLGFDPHDYDRPLNSFSGGQQNRAALGRLLLSAPDLLLLDEPTNHLDIAATEWLEDFLLRSSQAVLVVSHDRYFLNRLTSRTLEIYRGGINDYAGNFSAYWSQREERHKVLRRTWEKQQEFIEKTKDFIARNAYGQKSTQAKDREKKLERVELVDLPPEFDVPPISFPEPTRTGDWVFRVEELSKTFNSVLLPPSGGEGGRRPDEGADARLAPHPGPLPGKRGEGERPPRPLFEHVTFQVDRGERLAIFGPNGSGKTTLLRILLGELKATTGTIRHGTNVNVAYFDQQLTSIDASASAVEAVRPVHDPSVTPGQLRGLLARFGIKGDLATQTVGAMSGGEKTRVALARLASAEPNVLVLDEPTNHLDFWSAAALEEALRTYPGTVVFVSHDRFFLDQVATRILVLKADGVDVYD
ncbi:MAG: ABC-F family ATP-binding cassette domain-containing protein, partial [Planctomycetaceae bacterium]|nr:ABC-F family ATP-binding cassette domain-containing protein [Planctomycetaceae bacterium]